MAVSAAYLAKIKRAVRLTTTAPEIATELWDTVEECRADLIRLGLSDTVVNDETDIHILDAVKRYARWRFAMEPGRIRTVCRGIQRESGRTEALDGVRGDRMRMDKIVKLRTLTVTSDSGGFPSKSVSTVEVYADTKSVRQSEYYAADAKGKRLELVLVINADDWNGATEAELNRRGLHHRTGIPKRLRAGRT